MPLVEFLERFGLDRELIERDRAMSAGFARAYVRQAETLENENEQLLHALAAATEYRRAGAHSVLLSDRRSVSGYFRRAGETYCRIGNPYGLLMLMCADYSPGDLLGGPAREFGFLDGRVSDRLQLAYVSIVTATGEKEPAVYEGISGSSVSPIGILGISVGAYVDLAHSLSSRDRGALSESILPFLSAYNDAMRRARANSYHWRRMAMPFHPAEPDILSVLFLVEAAMRYRGRRFIPEILERVPLAPDAANLLYNAVAERFGDNLHTGPAAAG
jgi:hypothetical protein